MPSAPFRLNRSGVMLAIVSAALASEADAAAEFNEKFPEITFEEGLKIMGPIKIPENRPV